MTTLVFDELGSGDRHVFEPRRVIVAGFTGRDTDAVAEHLTELDELGVPVPVTTPSFYVLGPERVRQSRALVVSGSNTSGEVEPVIFATPGGLFLTAGSDHTDRDLERTSIAVSKAACQKVVADRCVPVAEAEPWDEIELVSHTGGELYQSGTLASLLPLSEVFGALEGSEGITLEPGDVLFLGTIPTKGGIRATPTFSGEIQVPGVDETLTFSYRVVDVGSTGGRPLAKSELEFYDVDQVDWVPVPRGIAGQSERTLAVDPSTGLTTRMLRFEPRTDTTELGVLRHDFWEEVYILSGELYDITLDQTFGAGTYACRPPGMPHGPWRSPEGCVTFEVRYPAI